MEAKRPALDEIAVRQRAADTKRQGADDQQQAATAVNSAAIQWSLA
ncbi:hypothetical protein [uncultured Paludibaculum sp.]